ncbi:hypothetical protein VISI1226_17610 [Vibrio sinaloensis DSM 21326]|uniref:Uncharacterized protein n=1 Tax=Vibrio sinaloensis DSM 21326 TaxID=945550 RepID=E8M8H8_PHOS4|nr:hypothetical protein VISI1226_17610 [Vibrio sinaloensis DSM 21326]
MNLIDLRLGAVENKNGWNPPHLIIANGSNPARNKTTNGCNISHKNVEITKGYIQKNVRRGREQRRQKHAIPLLHQSWLSGPNDPKPSRNFPLSIDLNEKFINKFINGLRGVCSQVQVASLT